MSISIDIDNPEEAILLIDGLTANSHAQFQMKTDLLAKMHRAILEERYRNVWRQIEDFPDYEMSGGGLIRWRNSHESVVISVTQGDPITVKLDGHSGWEHQVIFHDVWMGTFPELEV
jgi:hypothetical protein